MENSTKKRIDYLSDGGNFEVSDVKFKIIIPFPHNNNFECLNYEGWEVINTSYEKRKGFLTKELIRIQPFILENIYINDKKTQDIHSVILNRNMNNLKFNVVNKKNGLNVDVYLNDIDLWLFEDKIAFFVLNFALEKETINNFLNTLSVLKKFRELYYDGQTLTLEKISKKSATFIEFLCGLSKDVLKIDKRDLDKELNNKENDLSFIFNLYEDAKIFSVAKVASVESKKSEEDLDFSNNHRYDFFRELSFYFASAIPLDKVKGAYDSDIYNQLNEGGIFIDQHVSSVVLYDGISFIADDYIEKCKMEEYEVNAYLIYLINLYMTYKSRYYEFRLTDKYKFFDLKTILDYNKLSFAKNFLYSESIGTTYKNDVLHKKISKVLDSKNLLESVMNKFEKTEEIYSKNLNLLIVFFTIVFSFLFTEPIKKMVDEYIESSVASLFITFIIIVLFFVGFIWIKNRFFKWVLKFSNL